MLDGFKGWKDWSGWEGVQSFYRLLEWMNGPESRFESSGCGFKGPHTNTERKRWPGKLLTTGGLIFLFRDLSLNLSEQSASWAARPAPQGTPPPPLAPGKHVGRLVERSRESLEELGAGFEGACVNLTLFTTFYAQLPRARRELRAPSSLPVVGVGRDDGRDDGQLQPFDGGDVRVPEKSFVRSRLRRARF